MNGKKILYFSYSFFIILFLSFEISAQDYQIFFSNRTYIYEYQSSGRGHFVIFKSDTMYVNGNDTVFSNYRSWDDDQLYTVPIDHGFGIAAFNDSTWCGYKCIINEGGENIILTHNSDSLNFHPNALLNDSWEFYKFHNGDKFIALVTSILNDSVFGTMDSVKSISIQKVDSSGLSIPDILNNFNFRLSKSYGLLNTVNIKHFPLQTIEYELKGIDSVAGEQPISPSTIYDFDIGDVFHYYSWNQVSASVNIEIYEKRTILTKSETAANISYSIDDSVVTVRDEPFGNLTTSFSHTIRNESYSTNPNTYNYLFRILPHSKNKYYLNYITTWHRWAGSKRGIYTTPCISFYSYPNYISRSSGSCTQGYCSFPGSSNWFVEGLGLIKQYSSSDSASSIYTCSKQMTYYKKGNEVYGTPLVFPLITKIDKFFDIDVAIKIYPNPVNEFAIITNIEKISSLNVYDACMKKVNIEWEINDKKIELNCKQLPTGLYFVGLENEDSIRFVKMIVFR